MRRWIGRLMAVVSALVFAPAGFAQDTQYSALASTLNAPTLPFSDPGYAANGSFTVLVTNGSCAGTYTVNAAPVAGSGPGGSNPPLTTINTYIGFPAGSFLFANAGSGLYTVTVTETGACNPPIDPVVFQVQVPAVAVTPYTVTSARVDTSLPFGAPGFTNDGQFIVTIADGNCTGTYTVNATPVGGSGPNGSTPPLTTVVAYIGFPEGNFLFANAGPGQYTVTVTETGTCVFAQGQDPTIITVGLGKWSIPVSVPMNAPLALLLAALGLAGVAVRRLHRR
ncbi:MAG: hypothetical protein U1F51_06330 [Burkholderiales bacterium]